MGEDSNLDWTIADCRFQDPSVIIEKLNSLLSDSVAKTIVIRNCQLLKHYIRLTTNGIVSFFSFYVTEIVTN